MRRKDKLYWESSEVPFFVKGPGVRRGTRTASMRRALTGSVSDSVVRHAHCPVTVVRGEPLAFATKVLLASDGSQEATLAASIAIGISARTDSELHLVYAEPHARVGHPDTEIVGLAGKLGAGLIVVGSRGLGPLKRALMGIVSDSVVHHSPVPSWLCAAR